MNKQVSNQKMCSTSTVHRTVTVDGLSLFYREAGAPSNPKIVLLHGFPSSSHQYRNLISVLANHFHVVAPDYPGFGNSDFQVRMNSIAPLIDSPRWLRFLEGHRLYILWTLYAKLRGACRLPNHDSTS